MADTKISGLPASTTPLAGTEVLPIVQSGSTVKVAVSDLTAGRAVSALSLTSTNGAVIEGLTVGRGAGAVASNTAVGASALAANTGSNNTAIGVSAGASLTSGANNTAVGYFALRSNITGGNNTAVGRTALETGTTGTRNTAVGQSALRVNTADSNTALGYNSQIANTTGNNNVSVGDSALQANITANNNIAIGREALAANTASGNSTVVGHNAGLLSTGIGNQFFGYSSGSAVTTGAKNVILGSYTGSAAPISATGSNNIVLSDGDGVVRQVIDSSGRLLVNTTTAGVVSGGIRAVHDATEGTPTGIGDEVGWVQRNFNSAQSCALAIVSGTASTSSLYLGDKDSINIGSVVYSNSDNSMRFKTNAAERARIDSSGIVTMNAYGAGAATFSAAGVISSVSDETWKIKDGVPTDPDAMLKKLEPGYWYYNDEKKETFGSDRQLGFYAQNVNVAIGPEAAPTPEEGKPWGYYDRSVLAITVMSLQKALATIELLAARITALETS